MQINDDIGYRSIDGIRFMRYSVSESAGAGTLSNTPESNEVANTLSEDTYEDIYASSMSFSDNRLLLTSGGRDDDGHFRCMVSLDFANTYNLSSPPAASYDSIWTGLKIKRIFTSRINGMPTAMMAVYINNRYEMWKVNKTKGNDIATYTDGTNDIDSRIVSRLYTRGIIFNTNENVSGTADKEFRAIQLWLKDIYSDVDTSCYYRRIGYALWGKCEDRNIKADGTLAQSRYRLQLTKAKTVHDESYDSAPDTCNGMFFQFCIEITGSFSLIIAIFIAELISGNTKRLRDDEEARVLLESEDSVLLNEYGYEVS